MFRVSHYLRSSKMVRFIILCAAVLINNVSGQNQVWELNSAITDLTVGPATAVYCQLTSPTGTITFDDFGPCTVNIDRVTSRHSGVWTMSVVQQSTVLPVEQVFTAQVTSAVSESKPTVSTTVTQEKPLINLACSVVSTQPITACVFRDPAGRLLQAREGVSEDRYSFIESSEAGVQSCGIQINGPLTTDLGLWRCDLRTASDTYFGHLTVLCPWAMMDPEIAAAVVSVPTLTSQTQDQVVSEGDSLTMSCSIQSAIRYCYFRSQNGSVFNVRPGASSSFEYVGAGFDAGECGVRLPRMFARDTGTWSCHVGLPDASEDEQRVRFPVEVQGTLSVSHTVDDNQMVVEGTVSGRPALDYCRFVRIDGFGFTSENVPAGYTDGSSLSQGHCKIYIAAPTILDYHAWTVVVKVTGQDEELSQQTEWIVQPPSPSDNKSKWWLYVFVVPSIILAVVLVVFAFKRNRRWASDTASQFRSSLRRSPSLSPPMEQDKPPLPV